MKLASTALVIYGLVILAGGFTAYFAAGSLVSLISSLILFVVLIFLTVYSLKGSLRAGYLGGVLTFLLAIYFAYRFLATERFLPSGILLIISFLALFGVTLGVFLALQRRD